MELRMNVYQSGAIGGALPAKDSSNVFVTKVGG